MRGDPRIQAFCYLYNEAPRLNTFERIDDQLVLFRSMHDEIRLTIPFDVRDQRVLVVFDGDIPWCGLPKAADQVCDEYVGVLHLSANHKRKLREFELQSPFHCGQEVLTLRRRALLLPAGKALIMRYRDRSFAGWYSLVRVMRLGEDKVDVEFNNADY